jgi:hypothetical protein
MNPPTQPDNALRQALLDQIASITTMRPGTLAEEYREHPSPDGRGTVRLGPYFKHQVWQDGRNVSRRVPADQAATLKLDTQEAKRFHQLTDQLAQLNIQHTIALRAAEASETAEAGMIAEKKTSNPSASPKNTAKRNSTSPKRVKDSPKRKNNKT